MSSKKHTRRVSGVVTTSKKKGKADTVLSAEEIVDVERASLIQSRQEQLEGVVNKHDDMVREAFHLDKFVSLLSYDPQTAKADNSSVFRDYQAKHDLLSQYSAGAGPSRRTRRAQTELSEYIKGSRTSPQKPKGRKSTGHSERATTSSNTNMWSLLAEAKTKGKEKEKGNAASLLTDVLPTPKPGDSSLLESTSVDRKGKGKDISQLDTAVVNGKRSLPDGSDAQTPRKKRRTGVHSSEALIGPHSPISANDSSTLRSGRLRQGGRNQPLSAMPQVIEKPKPLPRKIKLIVRKPLPMLSHPRQKPPLPRYNESISKFLSSYISLQDGKDDDLPTLEAMANRDAAIFEKRERFRKVGRLMVGFNGDSSTRDGDGAASRSHNPWDSIIDTIVSRDRTASTKERHLVTSQITAGLRTYWGIQALKEDRSRALEEKRLRGLAKETIRLVINEWKRAVLLIREQDRLKLEAEERKRGHMHLDAILDQSGQILEAQQVDLSRNENGLTRASRSLTPDLLSDLTPWETTFTASGDEDEAGEEEDEEDLEQTDREDDEDDDEGTMNLLGADSFVEVRSSGSPSRPDAKYEPDHSPLALDNESQQPLIHSSRSPFDDRPPFPPTPVTDMLEMHPATPKAQDDDRDDHDPASITDFFPSYQPLPDDELSSGFDECTSPIESPVKLFRDSQALNILDPRPPHPELEILKPTKVLTDPSISDRVVESHGPCNHGPHSPADKCSEHADLITRGDPTDRLDSSENINPPIRTPSIQGVTTEPGMNVTSPAPGVTTPGESGDAHQNNDENDVQENSFLPPYLRPFAVTSVEWDVTMQIKAPLLLRGVLRPYQQAGLEWLASLHTNNLNGILSDEMGLGKTIQTISLLAHLACDRGIWGPHLIIVPTSVLLNWEMEFKKFLPGFNVLSYHGNTKRRKELRQGWNNKYHFNVCITSYTLASRDAHIFKRKPWYYMVLDEAHMIKNFKSQRWNTLLMFRSFRRLLLTGTPLQNNLTELWALLQFLMSGTDFANLKEFGEWFSAPLEKAIELGAVLDDDTQQRVSKLHTVLRPYLLRRLKRDVEKELPSKFEHLVPCPLSKRQRFLYDEFMSRADTRQGLQSGVYQKIANILMQLRKVCNHPDLFEVRPIVTSFAMDRSAIANYEIKELLVRRQLLKIEDEDQLNMDVLGLQFIDNQDTSWVAAVETRRLDGTSYLPYIHDIPGEPPPKDTRTIEGFKCRRAFQLRSATIARWAQIGYLNRLRCCRMPIYSRELITTVNRLHRPLLPLSAVDLRQGYMSTAVAVHAAIKPYSQRSEEMASVLDKFAFATPPVVAKDISRIALAGHETIMARMASDISFNEVLHRASVKLQIAFPDPSLLQYDCGKLQELNQLLRDRKSGGHRVLIFTQMTRILDILELFLNYHGYLYLRLDGATKIEDRQYITERFNSDSRVFCFIASSRSGGVGINLTGADTVIFYDSDFNPQMDKQCEDRAHRIGQIRDVHIYRFISKYTVEEALLRKANQKRSLDDLVIQRGEFDWRSLFGNETALNNALGEVEDEEDARAAALATKEALAMEGADEADFGDARTVAFDAVHPAEVEHGDGPQEAPMAEDVDAGEEVEEVNDDGRTCADYMVGFIRGDMEYFRDWRL